MTTALLIRFLVGGAVVASFALVTEALAPKSLAGLFGAAPSVAIATLGLTIGMEGKLVAAHEAHAMIYGALAFFVYACCCFVLLTKLHCSALASSIGSLFVWLAVALGLWFVFLR
jgi:hypothetical protein